MSTNRDFDRIASGWLAEGPTELNDRVLDAALREVNQMHQRRRWAAPWRASLLSMRLGISAATALVAVAGILAFNLIGGVGNTPTTSPPTTAPTTGAVTPTRTPSAPPATPSVPTPYPTATSFTSSTYGYDLRVPAGWLVIPASVAWDGASSLAFDDPVADQILPPQQSGRCSNFLTCAPILWAFGMPTTGTLADWVAARTAADTSQHDCSGPESSDTIQVDGGDAAVIAKRCAAVNGIYVLTVLAVRNGEAYAFYLQENSKDPGVESRDRQDLLDLVATAHLGR